jgi:hypothetical protein
VLHSLSCAPRPPFLVRFTSCAALDTETTPPLISLVFKTLFKKDYDVDSRIPRFYRRFGVLCWRCGTQWNDISNDLQSVFSCLKSILLTTAGISVLRSPVVAGFLVVSALARRAWRLIFDGDFGLVLCLCIGI